MTGLGWRGVSLRLWGICGLIVTLASSNATATTYYQSQIARRLSGVEIGNGNVEIGIGETNEQVTLPNTVASWAARLSETCIELLAPSEAPSVTPTKLRVCRKPYEQLEEDQLKELEEIGWRRIFWSDMDGLRLERLASKNRAVRALEVKLFRDTREAIELFLVGNKTSQSFASVYEWLTPKRESKDEDGLKN